jgi:hypothetical protein
VFVFLRFCSLHFSPHSHLIQSLLPHPLADKEEHLLWDSDPIPFFISPTVVLPRHLRYSLVNNPDSPASSPTSTIRVYNAIAAMGSPLYPPARATAMSEIWGDASSFVADASGAGNAWQRSVMGGNRPFTVTVIAKLAMLGLLKFSTLDPRGMGVEMEGGKPGWNDAMNGLPGLIGSGMPETYEMLRILRFVSTAVTKYARAVDFPTEFAVFLGALGVCMERYQLSGKTVQDDFVYWDSTNAARELYREATVAKFAGTYTSLSATTLLALLTAAEHKVEQGIARALALNDGFSPTYFHYECTDFDIITPAPYTAPPTQVVAKSFALKTLPNFLEGPTRQLKTVPDLARRAEVYRRTRASAMYDAKLQMYMLCESLADMAQSIGRMKAFSAGWLENQSIWLHMSYKFYLELLRGGLYDQFFHEIQTGLVPFMNNKVYGRSPLEASSFIVSSAFPDPKMHGSGFLARLSGSTAEFLSMWMLMMAGPTPFVNSDDDAGLQLVLKPVLPAWLFTAEENTVGFTFLGAVEVVYHNPTRGNTWELTPTGCVVTGLDGSVLTYEGGVIDSTGALLVRNRKAASVHITF